MHEKAADHSISHNSRQILEAAFVARGGPKSDTGLRVGLQFPRHMPFEEWMLVGRQLSSLVTSSAWCLGDWMVYGESTYLDRYREAIEQTALDYQTLRNYAWVARRFSHARRRTALSFGHHAEVASLPEVEQDYWLRKAEELGWSRNRLRREVRSSLTERDSASTNDESSTSPVQIQLRLSPSQLELYELAAKRSGITVEKWAIGVLEQEARAEIE